MSKPQFNIIKTANMDAGLKAQVIKLIRKLYLFESFIMHQKELDFNPSKLDKTMIPFLDRADTCVMAVVDGDLVGVLLNDEQLTEISILYVEEKFRSQNIGENLVRIFIRHHKGKEVTVQCLEENKRAGLFYERVGFIFDPEPVKVNTAFNLLGRIINPLT